MSSKKIKVAIAGVGNCAQAIVEGIEYYRHNPDDARGLMNPILGGYKVTDIEIVAAFDISANKVGKDLSEAIYSEPNFAYRYPGITVPQTGVIVQMAPPLDGYPEPFKALFKVSAAAPCNVAEVLKASAAEMLLNCIPTESHQAARMFADAAIKEAQIGFINGMPTLIVCDSEYQKIAVKNGVPLIGDDVKSQFGGTAIHRALAMLMLSRGIHMDKTYQINFAGNTDFLNLMTRGMSKHKTKQEAVTSLMPYPVNMSTGFTHVPLMKDRKTSLFKIEGANFGNAPLIFEAKLEVEDSANFAGVVVDMVRYMRIALDRKVSGVLDSACSFLTKHPPVQIPDSICVNSVREFAGRHTRKIKQPPHMGILQVRTYLSYRENVKMSEILDIVSIGHIVREYIVFPDRKTEEVLGSPAAYSSVALARLGERVGVVTRIGADMPPPTSPPVCAIRRGHCRHPLSSRRGHHCHPVGL